MLLLRNLFCLYSFGLLADVLHAARVIERSRERVTYLNGDNIIDCQPLSKHRGFFENDLHTYCYKGSTKTIASIFESLELHLEIEGDDFIQYEGTTPQEVEEHFEERRSFFNFDFFTQKRTRLSLSPFKDRCIGIDTLQPYRVRLDQEHVNLTHMLMMLTGVFLFLCAGSLSNNSLFYYMSGIVLGVCLSFMLVIWLTSKLLPRRTMMYGALIGGWTIGFYLIQRLWDNLQLIMVTYRDYVFWYVVVTGFLSFLFCYRMGPPKNERSKNVVKWILQLVSLLLIWMSTHYEEAAYGTMLTICVLHYFPRIVIKKFYTFYVRRFPPKRRLLTKQEYHEQGLKETSKALEELRQFVNSPNCKQWRLMTSLRDPVRFASFVEGDSHVSEAEITQFENSVMTADITDSEPSENESDHNNEIEGERLLRTSRSNNRSSVRSSFVHQNHNAKYLENKEEEYGDDMENNHILVTHNHQYRPSPRSNVNLSTQSYEAAFRTGSNRNTPRTPRSAMHLTSHNLRSPINVSTRRVTPSMRQGNERLQSDEYDVNDNY